MNRKIIDHSTAGGASWGSQLAPGSFYLVANLRESNRTKTKPKNHLHSYLYKTPACSATLQNLESASRRELLRQH
jgi:hypothetical protein